MIEVWVSDYWPVDFQDDLNLKSQLEEFLNLINSAEYKKSEKYVEMDDTVQRLAKVLQRLVCVSVRVYLCVCGGRVLKCHEIQSTVFFKVKRKSGTREDIPEPPASPSPPRSASSPNCSSSTHDTFTPMLLLAEVAEVADQLTFLEFSGFSSVQPLHYVQYIQQKLGLSMDGRYSKQIMKNNKKVSE